MSGTVTIGRDVRMSIEMIDVLLYATREGRYVVNMVETAESLPNEIIMTFVAEMGNVLGSKTVMVLTEVTKALPTEEVAIP